MAAELCGIVQDNQKQRRLFNCNLMEYQGVHGIRDAGNREQEREKN